MANPVGATTPLVSMTPARRRSSAPRPEDSVIEMVLTDARRDDQPFRRECAQEETPRGTWRASNSLQARYPCPGFHVRCVGDPASADGPALGATGAPERP